MIDIWTEKYRPETLSEVVGQKAITERLQAFVRERSMPHMLFAGSAGVGKTTCAIALAKELYGAKWQHNFMETNASDERGIQVVRGKIKDFAKIKPFGAEFKIIFLDESDALTPEAQQALRRTMERYTGTTRFILSCNYSSKLIPPIQSRCAVFRFRQIDREDMKRLILKISKKEGLRVSDDALDAIVTVAGGDMRQAINVLQSASIISKNVTAKHIYSTAASLDPKEAREILELSLSGKFLDSRKKLLDLMIDRGMSGLDVLRAFHRELLYMNINDVEKARLIDLLGEYEFRIVQGGTEDLQIEAFLAQVAALKDIP